MNRAGLSRRPRTSLKRRMARKPGKPSPQAIRDRAAKTAAAMASPGATAQSSGKGSAEKKGPGLFEFIRSIPRYTMEVRAEARKITWTSRRETWVISVMVAIMVTIAALFFWGVNTVISLGLTQILKLANPG